MEQQIIDRMRNNLSTADPVKCGWAKIVLDLLMEIEMEHAAHERTISEVRALEEWKTRNEAASKEVADIYAEVVKERDELRAQIDEIPQIMARARKVEATRQALLGVIPKFRHPSNHCWCPEARDIKNAGHDDDCVRAQVAVKREK